MPSLFIRGIEMIAVMPDKAPPNLIEFEQRPIEDRQASIAAGHLVMVDVEFAKITPPGGNLVVEKAVADFTPDQWEMYRRHYDAWKEGIDPPEDGTSIRHWPVASPANIEMCRYARVRTVEELAAANASTLTAIGPGAMALQAKARAWLEEAKTRGVVAEENAALKVQLEELFEQNRVMMEEIAALKVAAGDPPKRPRGRPRKEEAA